MVEDNSLFMSEESKSRVKDFFSFDGKNLLAGVGLVSVLLMVGGVFAQAQGTPDVSVDSNGVQVNTGTLDVNGNQIEDAGSIIYDPVTGTLDSSVVDFSRAVASDVGLGNVRNIDLSTTGGSFLTYDTNNEEYNVDGSSIQSGTTASDVGLGNVGNYEAVDVNGDLMNQDANLQFYDTGYIGHFSGLGTTGDPSADSNHIGFYSTISSDGASGGRSLEIQSTEGGLNSNIGIKAAHEVVVKSDVQSNNGGPYECWISADTGDWNCDGTKGWVHDLGNGSKAYYTSQESPEVRAVYEGQTTVDNGIVTVSLPSHFEKTVSDTKPMLRVQATPHELATVAVTERSDSSLTIEASKDVTVDYRVTGIREGYEDKQVVRPKEE